MFSYGFLSEWVLSAKKESEDFLILFSYSSIRVRGSQCKQGVRGLLNFVFSPSEGVSLKTSLSSQPHHLAPLLASLPNAEAEALPNVDTDADDDHGRCCNC